MQARATLKLWLVLALGFASGGALVWALRVAWATTDTAVAAPLPESRVAFETSDARTVAYAPFVPNSGAQAVASAERAAEERRLRAELDALRNETQGKIRRGVELFKENDKERAKLLLSAWNENELFARVIGHPHMLAEQMQHQFSPGVAAELAVLYYSVLGFICTRKLQPMTNQIGEGPYEDKMTPAWVKLYKEWDTRARDMAGVKNLVKGEILRISGESGLLTLQRAVIPDVPRDHADYRERCKRLDERYVLRAWRFLFE